MVRKLSEVCSITFRSWVDQCWTCLERSVKAIKRQDNAEGPAVPGCRRREGRMRYHSREVRAGRRKGPCGTTFLLWMDHLNPGGSRGAAGVGGAGHNLAKLSQDPWLFGEQRRWGQWRQREFQPQSHSVIFTLNSHNVTSVEYRNICFHFKIHGWCHVLIKNCCLRLWRWPCPREVMMDHLETREWRQTSAFGMVPGEVERVQHLPCCPSGAGNCYPT